MKVLIVYAGHLGDVVMATPIISHLDRICSSGLRIEWITRKHCSGLLRFDPRVCKVYSVSHMSFPCFLSFSKVRILLKAVFSPYDLIVSLQMQSGVGLLKYTRANKKIGYPYSRVIMGAKIHKVDEFQDVYLPELSKIFQSPRVDYLRPKIVFDRKNNIRYCLPEDYVVLVATTSKFKSKSNKSFKNWPIEYWKKLLDALIESGNNVVITHAKQEKRLIKKLKKTVQSGVISLVLPIDQLCHVVNNAKLLISADTGPMHIGFVLETPVIAIFGPSPVWQTGSYSRCMNVKNYIFQSKLECCPCQYNCKECSINKCMFDITPQMVFDKAIEFLK